MKLAIWPFYSIIRRLLGDIEQLKVLKLTRVVLNHLDQVLT